MKMVGVTCRGTPRDKVSKEVKNYQKGREQTAVLALCFPV